MQMSLSGVSFASVSRMPFCRKQSAFILLDLLRGKICNIRLNAEKIGIVKRVTYLSIQNRYSRCNCPALIL